MGLKFSRIFSLPRSKRHLKACFLHPFLRETTVVERVYTQKKAQNEFCIFLILNLLQFVGVAGFEPTTPCSQSRCANRTALHPVVPDPDPVIGLVQPHRVVVCQSRAFPAGGTFRIPGCKDNRFFLFRQTFSPKSTVPGGAPDSGCVSCRFACRTFFAALVSGFGAAFCRCPDVFLSLSSSPSQPQPLSPSLSLSLSLFQSLLPFLYLFRIPVFYSFVACSGFPVPVASPDI